MGGRRCGVCEHEARVVMEEEVEGGVGLRVIAERYGVSKSAVSRHWQGCGRVSRGKEVEAVSCRHCQGSTYDAETCPRCGKGVCGRCWEGMRVLGGVCLPWYEGMARQAGVTVEAYMASLGREPPDDPSLPLSRFAVPI
jgi:hypothetical protein